MAVGTTAGPFRSENEDRVAVATFDYSNGQTAVAAIICDGMGGLLHGADAASEAISVFLSAVATAPPELALRNILEQSVRVANQALFQNFRGEGGTTLTAVLATPGEAWMIHVGDSRLYGYDSDVGLELLSRDDTVQGAVFAHQGGGDEDMLDNRLLQYVGVGDGIHPHLTQLDMVRHRFWLLTSDGAHSVGRKVIAGVAGSAKDATDVARKLVFVAEATGTTDNASVACVDVMQALRRWGSVGRTIRIWTPFEKLEVWLPLALDPKLPETAAKATMDVIPARQSSGKPPSKTSKRRKSKATAKSSHEKDSQMEVVFAPAPGDDN
jgi:serine/threonine protein phosphatase PrpC